MSAAKPRSGRARRFASAVVASRRLLCGARSRGPPRNSLRSLRSLRSDSRGESDDEARCARGHAPSAPRRLPRSDAPSPNAPLLNRWGSPTVPSLTLGGAPIGKPRPRASRQVAPGVGDFWGGGERRFEVGARSALRRLTRRGCLSAVSAANEASSAARPRTEHRSGVDAQHRPPQHEPTPGAACRDAPNTRSVTCRDALNTRSTAHHDPRES